MLAFVAFKLTESPRVALIATLRSENRRTRLEGSQNYCYRRRLANSLKAFIS